MGKLKKRKDNGKLPAHIPEPLFIADPNHHPKGLTGKLIKLCAQKIEVRGTLTRMDCTWIGKNFGYMARTLRICPVDEFRDAAKAVLLHHFNDHTYCGAWCPCKLETQEQRDAKARYYRCKEKDADLHDILEKQMAPFIQLDKLTDMAHGLDTNMNEAFNQVCTWFAPQRTMCSLGLEACTIELL
jgi:ferredoxin-thioredoxin reductase catalytic subunit